MILILVQLAILLLTAWGWGFWLWKFSRADRAPGWKTYGWFFFGLAGLVTCILFLHALIYLNLPLKLTSWVGLLIALAGVGGSLLAWRPRPGVSHRYHQRESIAATLLFATVFAFQGAPLFSAGPENYYGSAHTDQVNYVLLAEFLVDEPFKTPLSDVGLHPWMAKAIHLKIFRLGQSVANGYLGVTSLADAKRAYGTLSIFMVGIGALSVFILARVVSVPRTLAFLIGIWWGLLPAITKMHLDGFFSQACVLFVFPALAAVFYVRRGRLERIQLILMTLYLAYLLCTYTEVYALGVGLVGSLVILAARPGTLFRLRLVAVVTVVAGSLLLAGGYLQYFFSYVSQQYKTAASPISLADLVPMSGTWIGWKQIFFGYEAFTDARLERLLLIVGFALIFVFCCAFQGRNLAKRRFLLAMIVTPLGVLALLLSAPVLPKYAFSKLLDTFTTFWLVVASVGLLHLGGFLGLRRVWVRAFTWLIAGLFVVAALDGSWPQWRAVREDQGILADVDSKGARLCYAAAQKDRSSVFLIAEPHNIVCAWLAYAARRSNAYVDASFITDLPIPATIYAFRRLPEVTHSLVILDEKGPKHVGDYQGPPELLVRNPQGIDGGGDSTFYWIGPDATIELLDYNSSGNTTHHYALDFEAMMGPANPIAEREIALIDPAGTMQKLAFTTRTSAHFEVTVHPGKNSYILRVLYPTEQTFRIPADPRDHMVRVQQFALSPLTATDREAPVAPSTVPPTGAE